MVEQVSGQHRYGAQATLKTHPITSIGVAFLCNDGNER